MTIKKIFSGIFFLESRKDKPLHVAYDYNLDDSILPPTIFEGEATDVYIYGMYCNKDMNALACYTHFGKNKQDVLKYQKKNGMQGKGHEEIPLHITLTTGIGIAPVEAGMILSTLMVEANKYKPNMNGYFKLPKLIKWTGIWGYKTVNSLNT